MDTARPLEGARGEGLGKVILLGEHAVVHGRPALAAALARGATACAKGLARGAGASALHVSPWGLEVRAASEGEPLARAFAALLAARVEAGASAEAVSVEAHVALPAGAGLGSSAALGVAVLRALDAREGLSRDFDGAQGLALAWERVFHGNPSGIDTAMALEGGVMRYVREPGPEGRRLQPIVPRVPLRLVVGETGEHASTRAMVEQVGRILARAPDGGARTLDGIAALVRNAELALEAGDLRALGQLFDLNHQLLAGLMLSTEALEARCAAARAAGALGAKLTGGGGGGCMIALVGSDEAAASVEQALRALGGAAWTVVAGATAQGGSA